MKMAVTLAQLTVRLTGLALIVLGLLFWTDHAVTLVPLHMLLGFVLVLALWLLALLALPAGGPRGLAAAAALWGVITVFLGLAQMRLLPGSAHWVIRLLHLLVGLAAMGLAEALAGRTKKALARGAAP